MAKLLVQWLQVLCRRCSKILKCKISDYLWEALDMRGYVFVLFKSLAWLSSKYPYVFDSANSNDCIDKMLLF